MKRRAGFVSNSSSSSFCIMGVSIDDGEDSLYKKWEKDWELEGVNAHSGISEYYDCLVVGEAPEAMKPDETLTQFKQRVLEAINKVSEKQYTIDDLSWHTDGGQDG